MRLTYCLELGSCLLRVSNTSISIIAASLYFSIALIILIATNFFDSLSQHSTTFPNVPAMIVIKRVKATTLEVKRKRKYVQ
jgi:hypothetical protein